MKKVKLKEIKIKPSFLSSVPNAKKVELYITKYVQTCKQAKPILIDKNGYLLDGYIQYLILKSFGVEKAEVIVKSKPEKITYKNSRTIYVFGYHPKDRRAKEFVWRVPASWTEWANNVKIGDIIYCNTKYGSKKVVVNRIEVLSTPPVDICIRKVCKRIPEKKGE